MSLVFQIRTAYVIFPLNIIVGIGLTETPNSGWAKAQPAHPLAASLVCERPLRGIWLSFSCLEPNMAFLLCLLKTRIKNETSNRLFPHCVDLGGDGVAYLNTNIEGKDTPSRAKSDHLFSPDKRA